MGRGERESFSEVERVGLDTFDAAAYSYPSEQQLTQMSSRPLCTSTLHQTVGSVASPDGVDRVSVRLKIVEPEQVAKRNEPADLCQRCAEEVARRYLAEGWSVRTDPLPPEQPVAVAAAPSATAGAECRRLRGKGESGPLCDCRSGSCALGEPYPAKVADGDWVVGLRYTEQSGPGGTEEIAAYDTVEAAREHAEIFNRGGNIGARAVFFERSR